MSDRRWRRERIAILGGGVGAMAAAFALTERDGWRERFDITVYQIGWRLGGKGASGRAVQAPHQRIEEHGLHGWFGFYDNAFAMMRECYRALDTLGPWPPDRDLIEWGFAPVDEAVLQERVAGVWTPHRIRYRQLPGAPGQAEPDAPEVAGYLRAILSHLADALSTAPFAAWLGNDAARAPAAIAPLLATARTLIRTPGAHWLPLFGGAFDLLLAPLDRAMDWLWDRLGPRLEQDDGARRFFVAMDFGAAVVRGLLRDRVASRGFDAIDEELAAWLLRHGLREATLESDSVRAIYSSIFAFPRGDSRRPRTAAGPALRWLLRLTTDYRGHFLWKLRGGMGDVVFAPLYQVLRARGVKFEFFHRVRRLRLAPDRRTVDGIELGIQATTKQGAYRPLVRIRDRWCWPNEPDYTQLEEAHRILALQRTPGAYVNFESAWSSWGPRRERRRELRRGAEFDRVILGISLGALQPICADLIAASPRWRDMIARIDTIRTQAFQLWLKPTLAESGHDGASPFMTAYARPFETWGDQTHTAAMERWPPGNGPGQIAYFCGPMPDSREPERYADATFPARMRERVFAAMRAFTREHTAHLWPRTAGVGGLDYEQLIDPENRRGIQRLRAQYWVANIDPSERYVLTSPGTVRYRLRSDDSGFANLYLAGDWTYNGLNVGCVEAAVMSGRRAARAILGAGVTIIGEDHLDASPSSTKYRGA